MVDHQRKRADIAKRYRTANAVDSKHVAQSLTVVDMASKYSKHLLQSFRIIVDDRERTVIPVLQQIDGININVERITTGDYSIIYPNGKMIIIERKTWVDLASSIKDGRMNNIRDLLRAQQEQGAKCIYMVEGITPSKLSKKICGIPYRNLRSKLDHLILRDNMIVMETRGIQQTVDRIIQLGINCATLDCYSTDVYGGNSTDNTNKKELNMDEQNAITFMKQKKTNLSRNELELTMLCKLPGISNVTASTLLANFSFCDILRGLSEYQLKPVKYLRTGIALRKQTVKKLADPQYIAKNQSRILSTIKGLSTNVASAISENHSIVDIVNGDVHQNELADIKVGKRKVGASIAKKICEFFQEPLYDECNHDDDDNNHDNEGYEEDD